MTAVAKNINKEISLDALEKRKLEINKYLVQNSKTPHRLSLSHAGSFASQQDDTSNAPTPREQSMAAALSSVTQVLVASCYLGLGM